MAAFEVKEKSGLCFATQEEELQKQEGQKEGEEGQEGG